MMTIIFEGGAALNTWVRESFTRPHSGHQMFLPKTEVMFERG